MRQAAGPDGKVWVVPLVNKRTIITEEERYEKINGSWESRSLSVTRRAYHTGHVDYAVFSHERVWLDPESSGATGKLI